MLVEQQDAKHCDNTSKPWARTSPTKLRSLLLMLTTVVSGRKQVRSHSVQMSAYRDPPNTIITAGPLELDIQPTPSLSLTLLASSMLSRWEEVAGCARTKTSHSETVAGWKDVMSSSQHFCPYFHRIYYHSEN